MRVCGIDPGLTGGAFVYDTLTHEFQSYAFERTDSKINILALNQFMARQSVHIIFIEKILLTGREGGQSAMTIGSNYGRIMALLELMGITHEEVPPRVWQRALGLKSGSRTIVKQSAQELAVNRFTLMPFLQGRSKKPHDGLTDAACIALYGVQLIQETAWSDIKTKSMQSTHSCALNTDISPKKGRTSQSKKKPSSKISNSKSKTSKPRSKGGVSK